MDPKKLVMPGPPGRGSLPDGFEFLIAAGDTVWILPGHMRGENVTGAELVSREIKTIGRKWVTIVGRWKQERFELEAFRKHGKAHLEDGGVAYVSRAMRQEEYDSERYRKLLRDAIGYGKKWPSSKLLECLTILGIDPAASK